MLSAEAYWASLQGQPAVRAPRCQRRVGLVAALGWLATAALVLVALALVGLRMAGWKPLTIVTGSMAPTLRAGDLVLVSGGSARSARRGEVISFAHPVRRDATITHRVVSVRHVPDGWLAFTTRGDANRVSEHWMIPVDGRIARVRARVPLVGRMLLGGLRGGLVIMVASMAVAVVVLRRIWRPLRP